MRMLKWAGLGLGGLLVVLLLAVVVLSVVGASRLNRTYDIDVATVPIPSDSTSIARGRHLVEAMTLCAECHGEGLAGEVFFEAPMIASAYASNLTSGRGGIGATYSDRDYVRAIRHGVNADGRGLMIMHSDAYHHLGEADLGAIIAYVKSVPPADNDLPQTTTKLLGRALVALGVFDTEGIPLIPAELIDHTAPIATAPPEGVTAEYGRYLTAVSLCSMCHGSDLQGGPPLEAGGPPGPNIAGYGARGGWSEEQFLETIRTGVTPYGKTIDRMSMPIGVYRNMTDDELRAIWRYVVSRAEG